MIRDVEIRNRARGLGVDTELVRKDHVLNHVLAAVAESANEIAFRGGTALARVYWPDFRISEDLDFLVEGELRQATEVVERAVGIAAERSGTILTVEVTHPASDMVRAIVWWGERQLAVDLNRAERPALPIDRRELNLPYSDLSPKRRRIGVIALEEILANKWFMLDDRKEARDLFDLWTGICGRDVSVVSIAEAFKAKYRAQPGLWRIDRARRLEAAWEERLDHQVADLPPFREAFDEIHARIQAWEADLDRRPRKNPNIPPGGTRRPHESC
jgi:predicted nucleotidyltransferase component of viral defense system